MTIERTKQKVRKVPQNICFGNNRSAIWQSFLREKIGTCYFEKNLSVAMGEIYLNMSISAFSRCFPSISSCGLEPVQAAGATNSVQVVLCQINIFCHQLTQNTADNFVRFTKTYTNCSKIQNTSFASFEFQNNFCNSYFVNLTKSVVIFWVNW